MKTKLFYILPSIILFSMACKPPVNNAIYQFGAVERRANSYSYGFITCFLNFVGTRSHITPFPEWHYGPYDFDDNEGHISIFLQNVNLTNLYLRIEWKVKNANQPNQVFAFYDNKTNSLQFRDSDDLSKPFSKPDTTIDMLFQRIITHIENKASLENKNYDSN